MNDISGRTAAVARTGDDLAELTGTTENIHAEAVDAAEDELAARLLDRHEPDSVKHA